MSDSEILREALRHARGNSHDPWTQVGAILVCGKKIIYAANRRVSKSQADKRIAIEHAERAAIYKAAAAGTPTAGSVLYAPWFACTDCARGIILAGVRTVVGLAVLREATPQRWVENLDSADRMLQEAGVSLRWVGGRVGATILFDGEEFQC
jgi:dCMP deaminase